MKNSLFILLLFFSNFVAAQTQTTWMHHWQVNAMDDKESCLAMSGAINFYNTRYLTNSAYVGITENGQVSIMARKGSLDRRYISKFGFRIGKNKAILHPIHVGGNAVTFSPEKSLQILNQLKANASFLLQLSFFPDNEVTRTQVTDGQGFYTFKMAMTARKNCLAAKGSKGWVGIAFTDMGKDDANYNKIIKDNTGFSNPGVIVWTVHPNKAARKSGLLNFDVILAVNDKSVDVNKLQNRLKQMKSGGSIELAILRGSDFKTITLTR